MRSQNQSRMRKPEPLILARKQVASRNYERVRVTVQAMLLRRMDTEKITVMAVSKEARVSVATIYRRQDLFVLIQQANPHIQRKIAEQVYQRSLRELQEELQKAKAEMMASQNDAQLTKLGAQRPQQESIQLKKLLLAYQRQVACLEEMLTHCTCGIQSNLLSCAHDKER
jgi:hypothetical protein